MFIIDSNSTQICRERTCCLLGGLLKWFPELTRSLQLNFELLCSNLKAIHCSNGCLSRSRVVVTHKTCTESDRQVVNSVMM